MAILDVECSAGTYVRALARDLGAGLAQRRVPRCADANGLGPVHARRRDTLDAVREAAAEGRRPRALLRPVDTGLDAFPEVRLTEGEVAAIARGQFVRPEAGIPSHAERYRLVGPGDTLVAIAAAQGDRLAPDKVFVDAGALTRPD